LELISGDIRKKDKIILESKDGLEWSKNEISLKDFLPDAENKKLYYYNIELTCTHSFSKDIYVEVVNDRKQFVGALNVMKNNILYSLPLNFRILTCKDEKRNEHYLGHIDEKWINDAVDSINKYGLVQFGVKAYLKEILTEEVDENELVENGYLSEDLRVRSTELQDAVRHLWADTSEICVFLVPFIVLNSTIGEAWAAVTPTTNSYIVCLPDFNDRSIPILIHEIGHILGLTHTFEDAKWKKVIAGIEKLAVEEKSPENLAKIKELEKEKKQLMPYIFTRASTDNYMDYLNERLSFSKRQWLIMRKETELYHGHN